MLSTRERATDAYSTARGASRHALGVPVTVATAGRIRLLRTAAAAIDAALGSPRYLLAEPDDATLHGMAADVARELEQAQQQIADLGLVVR